MKRNRNRFLLGLLFVFLGALFLRLLLINWTLNFGNNGDFVRYEEWARIAHTYGFADTYKGDHKITVVNNEPPGTLYVLSGAYESYILAGKLIAKISHTKAGSLTWVNTYLQHIFMKSLPLLTDLLIGLLTYLFVTKEAGKKNGILAASLFLFNPIVWYNSAVWGQMDSINNFFFILSLFFAFRKKFILSLLAFALSIYIKLSLLPLLPFYLVFLYFFSGKKILHLLFGTTISLLVIIFATFSISSNPLHWLIINLPPLSGGELQNVTNAAFNFWWAITCFPTVCSGNNIPVINQIFLSITLNTWGYILFGIFTLPLLFLQILKANVFSKKKNIILLFSIVALCIFLFLPKMHDRYMYPFFPLFAVFLGLARKKLYIFIFGALILLHLINLIYSWYPTYFPAFIFYQILYSTVFRWSVSVMTVITFLVLYVKSFREFSYK